MKTLSLLPVSITIIFLVVLPCTVGAQQSTPAIVSGAIQPVRSTPALIDEAFARREISLDQWALFQAYALRDPAKLPQEFRTDAVEECASWIVKEIRLKWPGLSDSTISILTRIGWKPNGTLSRPTGLDSTRSTTHFLLHYSVQAGDPDAVSTTDIDGNGTPDYVDSLMSSVEFVWNYETNSMGYVIPPADGNSGGNSLLDIYLHNIPANGITSAETDIGDNPNSLSVTEAHAATSFTELGNAYTASVPNAAMLRGTFSHEFYHSIQNGYDVYEMNWMSEATAAWARPEVNPNDHYSDGYLLNWFASPQIALDANSSDFYSSHWYGSWIFFRYISEDVGNPSTIRRILERVVDYDNKNNDFSFSEISDVLAENSTSFNRVFRDFTTSNLVRTIYPYRYREGAAYPRVPRYIFQRDTTIGSSLPSHSSYYFQVPASLLPNCGKILTVTLTSENPALPLGAVLISYKNGVVSEIPFQPSVTLPGTETPDSLFIVVMNFGANGTTGNYGLKVQSRLREAHYTLTDLGDVGRFGSTMGTISNSGRVVGTLVTSFGGFTSRDPVTWDHGPAQYLGGTGYAWDINNKNDVIGYVVTLQGYHAHLWSSSGSRDLDTLTFGRSIGWGINDSGHAVGRAQFFENGTYIDMQPTLWKNGVMTKLPLLPDSSAFEGVALDINNNDQIIGTVTTVRTDPIRTPVTHTVLWNGGGTPIDISTSISLTHINDAGQYVGYEARWEDVEGQVYSYFHTIKGNGGGYSEVGMSDGTRGSFIGRDINNAGDIVGSKEDEFGANAFVCTHGGVRNLNEMLEFGTCWSLTNATGINDSGQICGFGFPASDPYNLHGFLLTPVSPSSVSTTSQAPLHYALYQNYPNPFNPSTTISFQVQGASDVRLVVYDLLGREVKMLVNERKGPGTYAVTFDASNLASGVYFCRLQASTTSRQAGDFVQTKKLILLR